MTDKHFDVAIIGAGFAGLYLLHKLRRMGLTAHAFEAGDDVGGTWYWNRYPGARCDIESLQYSYQFSDDLQQDWDWSERYATQPEILAYARHVAERYDLRRDITFNTRVASAHYDEMSRQWALEDTDGGRITTRFCIMATGCLSVPNHPKIEGLEDFAGPVYHTGSWPHDAVDFTGLRVGVIGTGSSAIQSIPLIAQQAAHLTVFQRTANYSIPARNGPLEPNRVRQVKENYAELRARAKTTHPGIDAVFSADPSMAATPQERQAEYEHRWQQGGLSFMGAFGDLMESQEANDTAANFVRDKIRQIVKDPAVAEMLCPTNIIGGKRLCVDTDYYATFNRDNVTLMDLKAQPISQITRTAIRTGDVETQLDALVIATGFDAMTGALLNIDIRGIADTSLANNWADGPASYLGLAIAGFPNLFTITGPGSPSVLSNMLPSIEQHVNWICDCLDYMTNHGFSAIEAEELAQEAWVAHNISLGDGTLKTATDSWYVGANIEGKPRVFMPYLGGVPDYVSRCEAVAAAGYEGFRFAKAG